MPNTKTKPATKDKASVANSKAAAAKRKKQHEQTPAPQQPAEEKKKAKPAYHITPKSAAGQIAIISGAEANVAPANDGPEAVGGTMTRFQPVFSNDSSLLFCASGKAIKVFSVATYQMLALLKAHKRTVTAVVPHPRLSHILLSSSLDGFIRIWQFASNTWTCIHAVGVGAPILHMVVDKHMKSDGSPIRTYVNVNPRYGEPKSEAACQVASVTITLADIANPKASVSRASATWQFLYKSKSCIGLAISVRGDYIASISGQSLSVYSVKQRPDKPLKHLHSRSFTTLSFHPTDPYIATGDADGRIILWYRFDSAAEVVTSSFHWHAHRVRSAVFSNDGAYLLSGGEEAVLVFWQLETGHKQMLPRLGAAIRSITVSGDGKWYALANADNTVRFVNAVSSQLERVLYGLQHAHTMDSAPRDLLTGLTVEPRNRSLVLNGTPGHIQFYDVVGDKHVQELAVIERNFVSSTDTTAVIPSRVEQLAFSVGGDWLATVERRADGEMTETVCLKFWRYDALNHSYVLNTRVLAPHVGRVHKIQFHPSKPLLATVGQEGSFKLWHLVQKEKAPVLIRPGVKGTSSTVTTWQCRSEGTYRILSVHDLSFSPDGSLLAVTFGQVITLWDPETLTLRHTLVLPVPEEPVLRVEFLGLSPYLVSVSQSTLYVWNLLTLTVWWSYKLPCVGLAAEWIVGPRDSSRFAVLVASRQSFHGGNNQVNFAQRHTTDNREAFRFNQRRKGELPAWVPPLDPFHHLIVFDGASPVPLSVADASNVLLERTARLSVASLTFLPISDASASGTETKDSNCIVYLTRKQELLRVPLSDSQAISRSTAGRPTIVTGAAAVSKFEELYGALQVPEPIKAAVPAEPVSEAKADLSSTFHAPSHVLPSVTSMYSSIMDTLLASNAKSNPTPAAPSSSAPSTSPAAAKSAKPSASPRVPPLPVFDEDDVDDDVRPAGAELVSKLGGVFSSLARSSRSPPASPRPLPRSPSRSPMRGPAASPPSSNSLTVPSSPATKSKRKVPSSPAANFLTVPTAAPLAAALETPTATKRTRTAARPSDSLAVPAPAARSADTLAVPSSPSTRSLRTRSGRTPQLNGMASPSPSLRSADSTADVHSFSLNGTAASDSESDAAPSQGSARSRGRTTAPRKRTKAALGSVEEESTDGSQPHTNGGTMNGVHNGTASDDDSDDEQAKPRKSALAAASESARKKRTSAAAAAEDKAVVTQSARSSARIRKSQ